MVEPPDGTGTVFVKQLEPGVYVAIWQGEGRHAGSYADVRGGRDEVLAWTSRCRASTFLAFDPGRDEYVAFGVAGGRIIDFPI